MSRMTEAQLSRIDNLEIGRYGYGAVKWPGLAEIATLQCACIISITVFEVLVVLIEYASIP